MVEKLRQMYKAYADTFREGGVLPPMMELKLRHTDFVVENAKLIAAGEGFDARTCEICEAAALLHDTGRYEQLKRYNTFQDTKSIDHAVFSHAIVKEKGWLDELKIGNDDARVILDAVLFHNRRELPGGLDPLTLTASQTVRDADKLDIFRVLEHQIATTDWRHDCMAFWNLPTTERPTPSVVEAVMSGTTVEYQGIKSLADFVLIQVGWMRSGLCYPTSRRLCFERKHLEFRHDFLHQLTDDPCIDEVCDSTKKMLSLGPGN